MSILHMDGFTHYGVNGDQFLPIAGDAYDVLNDADVKIITMPVLGGLGLNMVSHSPVNYAFTKDLGAGKNTGILGIAFHFYRPTPGNGDARLLFNLADTGGTDRYQIFLEANGSISIYDGSFFQTAPVNISNATLYYLEFKIIFAGSGAGSVEILLNGASWVIKTGVTTNNWSLQYIKFFNQYTGGTGWPVQLTNLIVWDEAGSVANDYMGEQFVYTLFPSADTADADWTLSSGTDGFDLINDVPADDSTNYLEANTIGDVSIFDLDDLPTTSLAITATMVVVRTEKTGTVGGTLDFGPVYAGTPSLKVNTPLLNGTYTNEQTVDMVNPDTGVAWLSTEINGAQIEISRSA